MALFGKKTKSVEEILKEIEALSEEDKNTLMTKLDQPTEVDPEQETDVDEVTEEDVKTEEKVETSAQEPAQDTPETPAEATPEAPTDVPTEPQADANATPDAPPATPDMPQTNPNQAVEPAPVAQPNYEEEFKSVNDRIKGIEDKMAEYDAVMQAYNDFVSKNRDSIGAESKPSDGEKDIHDMSAEELGNKLKRGI